MRAPSPTVQKFAVGQGTREHGGCCASMGHVHSFGSTEEPYELMVFGTEGKGKKGDAPMDHTTGRGWVKSKRGQYYDALHVKRCIVVLWLFETKSQP